jgi:hypothetical protein
MPSSCGTGTWPCPWLCRQDPAHGFTGRILPRQGPGHSFPDRILSTQDPTQTESYQDRILLRQDLTETGSWPWLHRQDSAQIGSWPWLQTRPSQRNVFWGSDTSDITKKEFYSVSQDVIGCDCMYSSIIRIIMLWSNVIWDTHSIWMCAHMRSAIPYHRVKFRGPWGCFYSSGYALYA